VRIANECSRVEGDAPRGRDKRRDAPRAHEERRDAPRAHDNRRDAPRAREKKTRYASRSREENAMRLAVTRRDMMRLAVMRLALATRLAHGTSIDAPALGAPLVQIDEPARRNILPGAGGSAWLSTAARSERTRHDARRTSARARRHTSCAAAARASTSAHARGGPRCASQRKGEPRRPARGGPWGAATLELAPQRPGTSLAHARDDARASARLSHADPHADVRGVQPRSS
jgi:hypothetical protein